MTDRQYEDVHLVVSIPVVITFKKGAERASTEEIIRRTADTLKDWEDGRRPFSVEMISNGLEGVLEGAEPKREWCAIQHDDIEVREGAELDFDLLRQKQHEAYALGYAHGAWAAATQAVYQGADEHRPYDPEKNEARRLLVVASGQKIHNPY